MADFTLFNWIKQTIKAFGDITDTFDPLVDLETIFMYRGLTISSTLDKSVVLQFTNGGGTSELIIRPNSDRAYDGFRHNGVIDIKYETSAPVSGELIVETWRQE